jgi:hypothetical protein
VFYALTGSSGVIGAAAVDPTHIKAHRSAAGAKGGLSTTPSAVRAADGRLIPIVAEADSWDSQKRTNLNR